MQTIWDSRESRIWKSPSNISLAGKTTKCRKRNTMGTLSKVEVLYELSITSCFCIIFYNVGTKIDFIWTLCKRKWTMMSKECHFGEIFQCAGNTVWYIKCHNTSLVHWNFFFQPIVLWHFVYRTVFQTHKKISRYLELLIN